MGYRMQWAMAAWGAVMGVAGCGGESQVAIANKPIPTIGPVGEIGRLHTGFKFTEGPAADDRGNLYFADIPNQRIHKLDAQGKLTVFREDSRYANGLMFDAKRQELFACEMDGQVVAFSMDGQQRRVVANAYQGKRLNAPNDLAIDRQGGIYFTDPAFYAPEPLPQGKTGVYYLAPDSAVSRLIDDLPNPNGVILSTDEKTLYVIPTGQAEMLAYPVESPGKIGKGAVFCTLEQAPGKSGEGGDGLAIDSQGNLYIASPIGLQVFDRHGQPLGILRVPEPPSNAKFGGKSNRTLYITACKSLYVAEMEAQGHVPDKE